MHINAFQLFSHFGSGDRITFLIFFSTVNQFTFFQTSLELGLLYMYGVKNGIKVYVIDWNMILQ